MKLGQRKVNELWESRKTTQNLNQTTQTKKKLVEKVLTHSLTAEVSSLCRQSAYFQVNRKEDFVLMGNEEQTEITG
jgi:hypothetical protein